MERAGPSLAHRTGLGGPGPWWCSVKRSQDEASAAFTSVRRDLTKGGCSSLSHTCVLFLDHSQIKSTESNKGKVAERAALVVLLAWGPGLAGEGHP